MIINKKPENVAAVHTHTHTGIFIKIKVKEIIQ